MENLPYHHIRQPEEMRGQKGKGKRRKTKGEEGKWEGKNTKSEQNVRFYAYFSHFLHKKTRK